MTLAITLSLCGLANGQMGTYITQVSPGEHIAQSYQANNSANRIAVDQISNKWNYVRAMQPGPFAQGNVMEITQTTDTPGGGEWYNNEAVAAQFGRNNTMTVDQDAGDDNNAGELGDWHNPCTWSNPLLQVGCGNVMDIDQITLKVGYDSDNFVLAEQWGCGNLMEIDQRTRNGLNRAGDHRGNKYEPMLQVGCANVMQIEQATSRGDNYAMATQLGCGNVMKIRQNGVTGNTAQDSTDAYADDPILQDGCGNRLVGSWKCGGCCSPCGIRCGVDPSQPATQISKSYNVLECEQIGNGNTVGLYQNASGYNAADIYQNGNNNTLCINQNNPCGNNDVTATQIGNNRSAVIVTAGTVVLSQTL